MGGKHRPASPRDRALGAELRAIREQSGMSLSQVGAQIHWNISTLSRLERGQRHVSPEVVMGLAVIYGLGPGRRSELLERARKPISSGWWDRQLPGVSTDAGALASYEQDAVQMTDWSPAVIPGLLQTPKYSEAIMREHGRPDDELYPRLGARSRRQEVLARGAAAYTAIIGIAALRNQLCGKSDFLHQLRHLARMGRRDCVEVRLVEQPTAAALGGWYLMTFETAGPAVHIEHLDSGTFLFDEEAAPYFTERQRLMKLALSVRATEDRLEEIIEQCALGRWA